MRDNLRRARRAKAVYANGRLSFEVALEPDEAWHTCLLYTSRMASNISTRRTIASSTATSRSHAETMAEWLRTVVKIQTSNEEFYRLFRQALEDMAALRLPIKGTDHMVFLPAAGLPWFIAPFGRDSLIVSLQNILIYPEFARGALEILGSLQAKEDDPLPRCRAGQDPPRIALRRAGAFQADPAHALLRHRGCHAALSDHLARGLARDRRPSAAGAASETAEGCLSWIDKYGDRDGDGFQEYQTRSPVGYENMAWKDSGDCRHLSGRLAGEGTEGALRASGLCLQCLGPHGRGLRRARQARPRAGAARQGSRPVRAVQRSILGRGTRLLCLCARWRQEARS